jgi:hypothetical protein
LIVFDYTASFIHYQSKNINFIHEYVQNHSKWNNFNDSDSIFYQSNISILEAGVRMIREEMIL